jgi:hypothetical protein
VARTTGLPEPDAPLVTMLAMALSLALNHGMGFTPAPLLVERMLRIVLSTLLATAVRPLSINPMDAHLRNRASCSEKDCPHRSPKSYQHVIGLVPASSASDVRMRTKNTLALWRVRAMGR